MAPNIQLDHSCATNLQILQEKKAESEKREAGSQGSVPALLSSGATDLFM